MGYSSLKLAPSMSAFPDSTVGSACTSSFSRFARRSLALRPVHSRSHQIRDRYPGASDISSPPCLPRLLPAGANRRVGLAPTGKAPPCHDAHGNRTFAQDFCGGFILAPLGRGSAINQRCRRLARRCGWLGFVRTIVSCELPESVISSARSHPSRRRQRPAEMARLPLRCRQPRFVVAYTAQKVRFWP
jgi:hypothetical protein